MVLATDIRRKTTSASLDPAIQSELGQYLTPDAIGRFMAEMFSPIKANVKLLEPGAGIGSLLQAFADKFAASAKGKSLSATLVELDPIMRRGLNETTRRLQSEKLGEGYCAEIDIIPEDYIAHSSFFSDLGGFTHVITNPPYRKISSKSDHAKQLASLGIKTPNLYAAFLSLAARQLLPNGELVAIVPRSFCNGPYFKAFRRDFFGIMDLRRVHVFCSRKSAFSDDNVLQESIIFHAVKRPQSKEVVISSSPNADFNTDSASIDPIGTQYLTVKKHDVFITGDCDKLIHLPLNAADLAAVRAVRRLPTSLHDLGLSVSTGPVVDFRLKEHIHKRKTDGAVPLIYAANLKGRALSWPIEGKKPQYIDVNEETNSWLWPSKGSYVVTKRFSSKEEKKRIVATVAQSPEGFSHCGWENHLNLFHSNKHGMDADLANGLSVFLNSSLVDQYFRIFNGHTQVNATDMRYLSFPDAQTLRLIGSQIDANDADQTQIDSQLSLIFSEKEAA